VFKNQERDRFAFAQKFYNGQYASFMATTRNAMNVFYVMDQIPELSHIPIVTHNRWLT
jgi:hypothetical protein